MQKFVKRIIRPMLPKAVRCSLKNYLILSSEFGQYESIRRQECVDRSGSPLPWYTYPAIEYIRQLDFSNKTVFEYGSGNSTLYWASRCRKVISVEDNDEWYANIKSKLPANVEYILANDSQQYVDAVGNCEDAIDIIIIDGNYRLETAMAARRRLKHDGFIILDNSDWHGRTSQFLRESDLIQVDMAGFGPLLWFTWTTSFFFSRNVKLTPRFERQPMHGIGAYKQVLPDS